ncbi:MAG: hypothetical protein E7047_01800 [Lentisphaerae bacterium]|nr:hypothetical protein [Lentisphaerota bacterium]
MVHYNDLPCDISPVVPWWVITGTVVRQDVICQLDDFKSKNIGEFFVYPTFGLEFPDFLTGEWFEFIRFLINECKTRGMKFWIYDELSWPSGAAGGRLLIEHPEYRMRTLRWQTLDIAPGGSWQPEEQAEYIWCAVRKSAAQPWQEIAATCSYCNDTGQPQQLGCIIKVLIDDHFFCSMGTSGTTNPGGIMDALNPDAVRCWMSYNYLPYEERFPEELGQTIRGFFYDEPTMVSPFHTGDIPWTPNLEEKFMARYNYSCRGLYWTLFEPVSGYEQFRYDFWRLTGDLFAVAFAKQLSQWCSRHGVMFSGHNWPEEPSCQRLMTTAMGDLFYQQQYLHVPGTDFLFYENNYAESAGMCPGVKNWARNLIYSAKHPSSVARYNNAVHTICESSACLGKKCGAPSNQKVMYDFLYAMGLSLMNPGCANDLSDFRKYVAAQDVAQSYWVHYKKFVDYMQVMSRFNSSGRTCTQIAVLNPVSCRMAFSNIAPDTSIRNERSPLPPEGDCAEAMLSVLDSLVRNHRDFELIFEDVILAGIVGDDGTLQVNNSAFRVIILPQCYALDDAVWGKLDEFNQHGGVLICVGDAPQMALKHDAQARPNRPLTTINLSLPLTVNGGDLAAVLEKALPAAYQLTGVNADEILTQLRSNGKDLTLFIANGTAGDKVVRLSGQIAPQIKQVIDLQNNNSVCRCNAEQLITLHEGDSLLFSSAEPPENAPVFQNLRREVFSLESNQWNLAKVLRNTMRTRLECIIDNQVCALDDTGAGNVVLDPERGGDVLLRGFFRIADAIPGDLRLWFDQADYSELTVNGCSVTAAAVEEPFFTKHSVTVPIAEYCQTGENRIEVKVPRSEWMQAKYGIRTHFHMLMNGSRPLILMGSFAAQKPYTLQVLPEKVAAGKLDSYGFEQFADVMELTTRFDLPETAGTFLQISEAELPLQIELNGVDLGVRFWKNGGLEIPAGVLKKSGNSLKIKLYGEMKNMLGRGWLGNSADPAQLVLPVIKLMQ